MHGKRQGKRSTKEKATTPEAAAAQKSTKHTDSGSSPQQEHFQVPLDKKKDICIAVYKPRDTIYMDQTGKFPHTSSRGHNYQMVIHEIDRNSTWIKLMKNKTQGELIKAQHNSLKRMQLQGIVPLQQILDNEISEAYKEEVLATKMSYQLVPPKHHRQKVAERVIQKWESHFIGVIAGTAATFPLHLWCQIIPQAERQLLLLSKTNLSPNISAYAYV